MTIKPLLKIALMIWRNKMNYRKQMKYEQSEIELWEAIKMQNAELGYLSGK